MARSTKPFRWKTEGAARLPNGEIIEFARFEHEGNFDKDGNFHSEVISQEFFLSDEEYNNVIIEGIRKSIALQYPNCEVKYIPANQK